MKVKVTYMWKSEIHILLTKNTSKQVQQGFFTLFSSSGWFPSKNDTCISFTGIIIFSLGCKKTWDGPVKQFSKVYWLRCFWRAGYKTQLKKKTVYILFLSIQSISQFLNGVLVSDWCRCVHVLIWLVITHWIFGQWVIYLALMVFVEGAPWSDANRANPWHDSARTTACLTACEIAYLLSLRHKKCERSQRKGSLTWSWCELCSESVKWWLSRNWAGCQFTLRSFEGALALAAFCCLSLPSIQQQKNVWPSHFFVKCFTYKHSDKCLTGWNRNIAPFSCAIQTSTTGGGGHKDQVQSAMTTSWSVQ